MELKMTGEDVARKVNEMMPCHDLRFDGVQENIDGVIAYWQFTAYEGPVKGASMAVKSCDPDAVQVALENLIRKFKQGEIR
uniref:Uncharacterized protein n=1 Tax=viral metagenome TaxID=1070528 RepID=A0A6M3INN2_9ZZZZ